MNNSKFPSKRVSNQNWFLGHDHARLARVVFGRAIWSELHRFRLDSWGAAKVRAAEVLRPEFAAQEQENKTLGLQEPQLRL